MKKALLVVIINFAIIFPQGNRDKNSPLLSKPQIEQHYNFLAVNQVYFWVTNFGWESSGPYPVYGGFKWPGGINAFQDLINYDGMSWGGIINDTIRTNGDVRYLNSIQPGKIFDDGVADDMNKEKYRVFKLLKGWESLPAGEERDLAEKNYNEWPVEDGAPWEDHDGNGFFTRGIDKPQIIGDGTLFYIYNYLSSKNLTGVQPAAPVAVEVQGTVWAYFRGGDLGDVIFRKYKLINKSPHAIKNMYFVFSSDVGLGSRRDNYIGCDTILNLAYGYNGQTMMMNMGPLRRHKLIYFLKALLFLRKI